MGKIFANHTFDKDLVFRIYKEPLQLSNKKNDQFKNGQRTWQWADISPKIYINGQKAQKKDVQHH